MSVFFKNKSYYCFQKISRTGTAVLMNSTAYSHLDKWSVHTKIHLEEAFTEIGIPVH